MFLVLLITCYAMNLCKRIVLIPKWFAVVASSGDKAQSEYSTPSHEPVTFLRLAQDQHWQHNNFHGLFIHLLIADKGLFDGAELRKTTSRPAFPHGCLRDATNVDGRVCPMIGIAPFTQKARFSHVLVIHRCLKLVPAKQKHNQAGSFSCSLGRSASMEIRWQRACRRSNMIVTNTSRC